VQRCEGLCKDAASSVRRSAGVRNGLRTCAAGYLPHFRYRDGGTVSVMSSLGAAYKGGPDWIARSTPARPGGATHCLVGPVAVGFRCQRTMDPLNVPVLTPVAWVTMFSSVKVPVASAKRPASRSASDGVDLDDREHAWSCCRGPCPSTVVVNVSPFAAVNVAAPVAFVAGRLKQMNESWQGCKPQTGTPRKGCLARQPRAYSDPRPGVWPPRQKRGSGGGGIAAVARSTCVRPLVLLPPAAHTPSEAGRAAFSFGGGRED
jgi:hypothetical protein